MAKEETKIETTSTNQLIDSILENYESLPKNVTRGIISDFIAGIESTLAEGGKLKLDKIGILEVKDRAARVGRNPQTGESIQIPASRKVAFRASKSLKDQINK